MKIVVTVIHIHQRVNVKLEKIIMMIYNLLHQYRMMIIYLYQSTIMNKIKCLNVVMINQQCEFMISVYVRLFEHGISFFLFCALFLLIQSIYLCICLSFLLSISDDRNKKKIYKFRFLFFLCVCV
jgi:hypothetical protein